MAPPIKPGVRVTVRVHREEHLQHYRREAQLRGVPLSDYLGDQLAAAHNLTSDDDDVPAQLALGAAWRRDGLSATARLRGLIAFWENHPEVHEEVRQRAMQLVPRKEVHDVA